jgi:hypothetical protein
LHAILEADDHRRQPAEQVDHRDVQQQHERDHRPGQQGNGGATPTQVSVQQLKEEGPNVTAATAGGSQGVGVIWKGEKVHPG